MQAHRSSSTRSAKTASQDRFPLTTKKSHRPSLSGPMNWLSRSSSSASTSSQPYAPSKPIRISEPQLQSAFETMAHRSGVLGAGATVVRTPQEALAGSRQDYVSVEKAVELEIELDGSVEDEEDVASTYPSSRPNSPPLPPIPDGDEDGAPDEQPTIVRSATPNRPTRPPPPIPEDDSESSSPSTPSAKCPGLRVLDSFPPVPALPANLPASPPQPPFELILLSQQPSGNADPAKVIVSLETSTTTHKTTMKTLMSRPSLLASYLEKLLPPPESAVEPPTPASRLSASDNSFHAIFQQHLASSGLLEPNASTMHIFLDRPSAP